MNKQNLKISMLATPLMIASGLMCTGSLARAQADNWGQTEEREGCSNRTIRGNYGYAAEGLLLGTPGLPPRAPFRSVGIFHYDGKGNVTSLEHTVINGMPRELEWTAGSGTYTVNSNCTGTAVVNTPNSPVPLNLFFVVVRDGREIRSMLNSNAIATVYIKVE